ncbi:hypothetical protein K438DRAFT_1751575 [Mycena galopus ATCC 62051]|nr:hypothetical protein K438DRAFT_1751575 [Mycena galopus ATCC 62051]
MDALLQHLSDSEFSPTTLNPGLKAIQLQEIPAMDGFFSTMVTSRSCINPNRLDLNQVRFSFADRRTQRPTIRRRTGHWKRRGSEKIGKDRRDNPDRTFRLSQERVLGCCCTTARVPQYFGSGYQSGEWQNFVKSSFRRVLREGEFSAYSTFPTTVTI